MAFNLSVEPAGFGGDVLQGARVVFVVKVDGQASDGPVSITATNPDGLVWAHQPTLLPGAVGEVEVWFGTCPRLCERTQSPTTITASRAGVEVSASRVMTVAPYAGRVDETGYRVPDEWEHFDAFRAWLGANRPELGFGDASDAFSSPASAISGGEHWTFLMKDWEVHLSWSTAKAPDDWCRINLRRRGVEMTPSLAFQIDSVSGKTAPHQIEPPASAWS
ncbi:MAG TPA: hypothetical protein VF484_10175 [Candidatus Limnocylindrales bacterium]